MKFVIWLACAALAYVFLFGFVLAWIAPGEAYSNAVTAFPKHG